MTDRMRMATPSGGEWKASLGNGSSPMGTTVSALTAPLSSARLQQAVSSWEAEYAVLSDANAKNAELQAMLRDSQPLLWLDDALVMQRKRLGDAPHKPAGRVARAKPQALFADDLAMEMESDLRRRRRVQWEIAKRIARVEREINRQPPGKRSWHVKEKQRASEEARKRQEEENKQEKQRREAEKEASRLRQEIEKRAKRKETQARHVDTAATQEPVMKERPAVKAAPKIDVDLEFDWPDTKKERPQQPRKPVVKTESESVDSDEEKENVQAPPVIQVQDSPDLRPHARLQTEDQHREIALARIARESFEDQQQAQEPADSDEDEKDESRPPPPAQRDRGFESSLGRQVLSEYRTMPAPVSFGAPPIIAGSQQPKRLNSDVLRRLFSDLDTDRDGHLNRIETCMALHRLQIDVPAPRIVAFFKRIRDVETVTSPRNQQRKRNGHSRVNEPLRQVISYKQFVAFVTAAFDQQQHHHALRRERKDPAPRILPRERPTLDLPPLQIQHTSVSSVGSPTRTMPQALQQTGRGTKPSQEEVEVRIVEATEEPLADRVMRELPDYLVSHALAAADTATTQSGTAFMQQIVRRSMEKVSGTLDISDEDVESVAKDLILSYITKITAGETHHAAEDDDTSGLGRAAAFFESLGRQDDAQTGGEVGSEHDEVSADWWRELTEEQIGSLVQEIWKSRQQAPVQQAAVDESAHEPDDDLLDQSRPAVTRDPQSVTTVTTITPQDEQKAQEVSGAVELHVQCIAEKAVQTESIEPLPPPPRPPPIDVAPPARTISVELSPLPPPPPPPPASPPLPKVQSTLARAVLQTKARSERGLPQKHRTAKASATATVLADLRRQRRQRQQATLLVDSVDSSSSAVELPVTMPSLPFKIPREPELRETTVIQDFISTEANHPDLEAPHEDTPGDSAASPTVESSPSLPVKEQRLQFASSPTRTDSAAARISLSSSGIFSSQSSSGHSSRTSFSLFRQLDEQLSCGVQERRHRSRSRLSTQSKPDNTVGSRESSEVLQSAHGNDADDLSEGEVSRREYADLSDGEIFGATRRKAVRRKNYGVMQDDAMAERFSNATLDVGGSVESGEMLPSMIHVQRAFHQRLIASSVSSLESGEMEDGMAASL